MEDLLVKRSTIPNAGNGLFAGRDYKKHEKIGEFTGKQITVEEADDKANEGGPEADYLITLSNGMILDVYDSGCPVGVANDAEGFAETGFKNNSVITEYLGSRVWLCATQKILAGSEIFAPYGEDYWDNYRKNH